jgi:hypothetical protein
MSTAESPRTEEPHVSGRRMRQPRGHSPRRSGAPPFGPGYDEASLADVVRLELWGTSADNAGEDFCCFLARARGRVEGAGEASGRVLRGAGLWLEALMLTLLSARRAVPCRLGVLNE